MKKYLLILLNILAIANSAWAEDINWEYNPFDFQYDMTVYINANVDGSSAEISRYSIAAFCGDECRGIVEVKKSGEAQYGYLRVRSNKENGEQISFKVYDNETGDYLKCSEMIDFVSQSIIGLPSSPMELKAANKYKVEFLVDEAIYKTDDVYYGETITLIDAPVKEGHTFAEWVGVPETMPAHDVIVIVSYAVNSYKLIFAVDDGVISEMMAEYGSEIVEPTAPEKEGHTFAGWSEHPETMPASDLIITGSYTVNKYKLTYVIGETTVSETEVEYGAAITAITAPEKEGHTFVGWEGVPETMPAQDVTVTGSYTINSYTLTFKIGDEVISESTVEYASTIVEPTAAEKEGYTFAGWSEHPEAMPASDLTVTGSYTVNKYKLTYMIGETVVSETEVEYGAAITAITAPEKEGHTFVGWEGVPETMPAQDVTVTGSYAINSYTLTFKIGDEVISESTVEYASTIVEPTAAEKEGYTFAGWSEHPETMPASDLTITGSYAVNTYKLTYVIGEQVISETEVEYGAAITAINAPEKEGHTFAGWEGVPETMPSQDVTVTGSYTINTYTVTYMIDDEVVRTDYVDYGAPLPEAPNVEAPEGYEFKGWSERPETMPAEDVVVTGMYEIDTNILNIKTVADRVNVYDMQGHLVKANVNLGEIKRLPNGAYVINHQKIVIR